MMRYKEGEFEFEDVPDKGTSVFYKRRGIGTIVTMVEASGRYCFRLGCDSRKHPRTYRGRIRAAQALKVIDDLKKTAKAERLSVEEVIVRAWDHKPQTAPS
jgi:nitrogenase subunit NifH